MRRDHRAFERLAQELDLMGEPVPGQPIVELVSDSRVLVENHLGITQYSRETLCIKVKFGHIALCGCDLELNQMTRDQLVITGRIDSIAIHRRIGK